MQIWAAFSWIYTVFLLLSLSWEDPWVLQLIFLVLNLWMGCIWVTWGKGAPIKVQIKHSVEKSLFAVRYKKGEAWQLEGELDLRTCWVPGVKSDISRLKEKDKMTKETAAEKVLYADLK